MQHGWTDEVSDAVEDAGGAEVAGLAVAGGPCRVAMALLVPRRVLHLAEAIGLW